MQNAVVLVAGRGTRLQSVTGDLPKPLLPLHGKPLVEHVLQSLRDAGFDRFLLAVGYKHELFYARYSGDRSVHFALQDPVDGTGTATLLARDFAGEDPFLLIYGDILADPADVAAMWRALISDPAAAGIVAVKRVEDPWQGAAVYEADGVLTRIVEKPAPGSSSTNWNSAGIYAFRSAIFEELERIPRSPRGEYELTSAIAQLLEKGARILVHPLAGEWRDVGRPEDLAEASRLTSASRP